MSTNTDFAWLVEHDQELAEKYPGQFVAIWKGKVIASGNDAVKVVEQADKIAPPDEFILHVTNPDVDVIYASICMG